MGVGVELGPSMSRSMLTVISVRRSHFEDVGDMDIECHSAVFNKNGVLGRRNLIRAEGEESMFEMFRGGSCTSRVR
jgi:hypothetical protein